VNLGSLIDAVGGFVYGASYSGDMDNLSGIKFGYLGENVTNIPSDIAYSNGNIYICVRSTSTIGAQLILNNVGLYYRRYIFGNWSNWFKLTQNT